ncbi:hypothetical protein [Helicobacter canis]|nr:hypothetical protein [Helicobacter canis]
MRVVGDSALRARFDKIENFLKTLQDSRILEIKTGLCKRAQGRILDRM